MLTKSSRGLGCLILFALPFAAGGLVVGYLASRSLITWYEARQWVETPARILQADLEAMAHGNLERLLSRVVLMPVGREGEETW